MDMMTDIDANPHMTQPACHYGQAVVRDGRALILLHGRGQSPQWVKEAIWNRLDVQGWSGFAPQAAQSSWYPERFLVPEALNQPRLAQALESLGRLSDGLVEQGIPYESQVLAGFSQGACLAGEFLWRRAQQYGGLLMFTGALLDELPGPRAPAGRDFGGMPVLLSTWDEDPHVPLSYVLASAQSWDAAGADVSVWNGPGTEHGIQDAEIAMAQRILAQIAVRIEQGEG